MTSTNLRTILSASGVAALFGFALLATTPQSEAQTFKRAVDKPRVIQKYCGTGFSITKRHRSYKCALTLDHFCKSGYVKEPLVATGNQVEYTCVLEPS